jgi:hypothetical protein
MSRSGFFCHRQILIGPAQGHVVPYSEYVNQLPGLSSSCLNWTKTFACQISELLFRKNLLIFRTIQCIFSKGWCLKGLSHENFSPVFWPVWIYLGLNGNRFWFLNFKEGSLIWDSYFKFWCVSCQTFSGILQISEKDWQLSSRFSNFSWFWVSGSPRNAACKGCQSFSEILRISENDWQLIPRFSEIVFQQHKRVFNTVVNPSWRFYESPRRFGMKRINT